MRPSTKELLDSIAEALETRVAPAVTDPWAASSLRSISTLLAHLSVRVECELTILAEGNADLREMLAETCARLEGRPTPSTPSLRTDLEALLSGLTAREPGGLATVASLEEESGALNEQLERVVRVIHEDRAAIGAELYEDLLGTIRNYFARQQEREAPLYAALAGPMF